ncbi:MAG TPA: alpha-amylase [Syntrophaceae bacterium]|jgi:alpha-amylase|nr:alpha-amylase [Syntrophaceae bacterium]
MTNICLYFHVHQPQLLRHYTFFDIDHDHVYEDKERNLKRLNIVSEQCYLPANSVVLDLITRYKGNFRIAFSITGILLDQLEKHRADVLDSFTRLADTGCVEFIGETYYHSFAFLFSAREFREQAMLHKNRIKTLFGQNPRTFRHAGLIYNNDLAKIVEKMGYHIILAHGADKVSGWSSPHYVYQPAGCKKLKLLLRSDRLSGDITLRFSNAQWSEYPLFADTYASWIHAMHGTGDVINLAIDYQIFGEHGRKESGIYEFMRLLPREILKHPDFKFLTPAEIARNLDPVAQLDVRDSVACADGENDISDWLGNSLQRDAVASLYGMEAKLRRRKDEELLRTWRLLQESENFYYMCTKGLANGDEHTFPNPYGSPYDAYINYMNIIDDFSGILDKKRSSTNEGA